MPPRRVRGLFFLVRLMDSASSFVCRFNLTIRNAAGRELVNQAPCNDLVRWLVSSAPKRYVGQARGPASAAEPAVRPRIVVALWRAVVGCCSCVLLGGNAWPMLVPAGRNPAEGSASRQATELSRRPSLVAPARRIVWNSVHLLKLHVRAEDRRDRAGGCANDGYDRGVSSAPNCSRQEGCTIPRGKLNPRSGGLKPRSRVVSFSLVSVRFCARGVGT